MGRTLFFNLFLLAMTVTGCTTPGIMRPLYVEEEQIERPQLTVALLPITDAMPFYIADTEGIFAEAGVKVTLIPVSSAVERETLVQTGRADCELTDIHGVVLTNDSSASPLRIISTARQSTPSQPVFYLVASASSGISDPSDLAGATIGISENTIIDYWTDRSLAFAQVDPSAVTRINVPQIPARLELLRNGQLDAAVLPDPLATFAQMQGATLLLDDSNNPDIAVSVIACRQDVIDTQRDAVRKLLAGWDQAVSAINADPAAFRDVLIEQTRVPEPLRDRYLPPQFAVETIPSPAQVADVVGWVLGKRLVKEAATYDEIIDDTLR